MQTRMKVRAGHRPLGLSFTALRTISIVERSERSSFPSSKGIGTLPSGLGWSAGMRQEEQEPATGHVMNDDTCWHTRATPPYQSGRPGTACRRSLHVVRALQTT